MNLKLHSPTSLTSLQKAAVLINALEMRSADALLDQMPAEQAARVREMLLDLDDVPVEAQEEVIAEFLRNGGRMQAAVIASDDGVELELSEQSARTSAPAFQFLATASPALLADFLRQEHPQTVAVVLAHLDPDQAARVLERLPSELSMESLARMARLHQLSPEVLADLEHEIRLQLLPQIEAEHRPQGLAGASAVLSALNDPLRKRMLGQLAQRDQALVRQLGYLDAGTNHAPTSSQPKNRVPAQAAKLQAITNSASDLVAHHQPRITFAQLTELNNAALKQIFAQADPQLLILALTGADERFVQRILNQLPTTDAAALRQRLNHPGALRLRDVDAAQEQLAQLAVELHEQGVVQLPKMASTPRFSLQT